MNWCRAVSMACGFVDLELARGQQEGSAEALEGNYTEVTMKLTLICLSMILSSSALAAQKEKLNFSEPVKLKVVRMKPMGALNMTSLYMRAPFDRNISRRIAGVKSL